MTGLSLTPFAIAVAPNGARKQKSDHPGLPISPAELAHEAAACVERGATLLHLHVRDAEGGHSLDVERYRAATAAVRLAVGDQMIIQVTTEAVGIYTPQQQREMVRTLRPEAVSLAMRELIPDAAAETEAAAFYAWLGEAEIAAQHILYSVEDVTRFLDLVARGVIPEEMPHALFVLGRYAVGQTSQPAELLPFLNAWPKTWPWSVCAFGAREAACMALAAALGGHARVGFENNTRLPDDKIAPSNAALVENLAGLVTLTGRRPATVEEARAIYGLPSSAAG